MSFKKYLKEIYDDENKFIKEEKLEDLVSQTRIIMRKMGKYVYDDAVDEELARIVGTEYLGDIYDEFLSRLLLLDIETKLSSEGYNAATEEAEDEERAERLHKAQDRARDGY